MFKPGMPRKPPQNGSAFSAAPWRMVFLDVSGSVSHTANVGTWGRVSDQDILMPFGVARGPRGPRGPNAPAFCLRIRCHGPMDSMDHVIPRRWTPLSPWVVHWAPARPCRSLQQFPCEIWSFPRLICTFVKTF